ncbi:NAD(P)-dependent oxidoreductase [Ensifer sp. MPMI2T]|nr:NAD(P)-dependent oxidoreductase [Ensifer sp. MPMI2T]
MASVLIVGGAGFVGSHVVVRCLEAGHDVHVLARPQTSLHRLQEVKAKIQLHRLHLDEREALQRCFAEAKPDCVFHLAVSTRRKEEPGLGDAFGSVKEDLLGLLSVVAAAAEARPAPRIFIRAGSLAAYGRAPTPHAEWQRERPSTTYAAGLVSGAHYVEALQPRLPFPVVTARLSLIYGPSQSEDFLIPSLIRRCLAGERFTVRRPSERRDLLFVDDAVDALHRLSETSARGGSIINIASGHAPTMRETALAILAATGGDPALVDFHPADRSRDVDLCPSPVLAEELIGWKARVSLQQGIEQTVAWWKQALAASTG